MIYAIILVLFIMMRINDAINKLDRKQRNLCYDLLILSHRVREDENRLLS